jgi:hypothetical protein
MAMLNEIDLTGNLGGLYKFHLIDFGVMQDKQLRQYVAAYLAIQVPDYVMTTFSFMGDCLPDVSLVHAPYGVDDYDDEQKMVWAPTVFDKKHTRLVKFDRDHRYLLASWHSDNKENYFRRGYVDNQPVQLPSDVSNEDFKIFSRIKETS